MTLRLGHYLPKSKDDLLRKAHMPNGIARHATICYYTTGQGLRKDCEIITSCLVDAGWQVNVKELRQKTFPDCFYRLRSEIWDRLVPSFLKLFMLTLAQLVGRSLLPSKPDLVIFLERLNYPTLIRAKRAVLIPNQEWYPERETYALKTLHAVLCKTRHAEAIFKAHCPQVRFISFTSSDYYLPNLTRNYSQYIHIAGKSRQKGTHTLIEVWAKHPEWPQLTVVYHNDLQASVLPDNVTILRSVLSEQEVQDLHNTHGIHICLSEVEGFGHYIVEAMSCKALVVTTDAPPMNEIVTSQRGMLTPVTGCKRQSLGHAYSLDKELLEKGLLKIMQMSPSEKARLGDAARTWYMQNRTLFSMKFSDALNSIVPSKVRTLGVAHE